MKLPTQKWIWIVPLGLIILGLVAKILFSRSPAPAPTISEEGPRDDLDIYKFDPKTCPGPEQEFVVQDVYLRGLLEKDSRVVVKMNWYACNQIKVGDIVAYRYSYKDLPVFRQVAAVGGDKFKLHEDREHSGWNLEINGKLVEKEGRAYFFGSPDVPPLGLYEKAHGGVLAENHVIVLSSFPPGDRDSGMFGAIDKSDIVGRVERQ